MRSPCGAAAPACRRHSIRATRCSANNQPATAAHIADRQLYEMAAASCVASALRPQLRTAAAAARTRPATCRPSPRGFAPRQRLLGIGVPVAGHARRRTAAASAFDNSAWFGFQAQPISLHDAAADNDIPTMEALLAAAPDPRAAAAAMVTNSAGQQYTPLAAAAAAGSEEAVKMLLDLAPETALVRCTPSGSLPIHQGEDGLCMAESMPLAVLVQGPPGCSIHWCKHSRLGCWCKHGRLPLMPRFLPALQLPIGAARECSACCWRRFRSAPH